MTNYEIGSVIKSLDFPGREDFYFTGVITEINGDMITARTLAICEEGEFVEIVEGRKEFRTPVQGAGIFDDRFPRVSVLATAAEFQAVMIGEEN